MADNKVEGKKKGEKFGRSTVYILKIGYVFHLREVKSRIQIYIFNRGTFIIYFSGIWQEGYFVSS